MTEEQWKHVFLILKVSFIFLNSLHICFYPELYLPGLRITKSVFGDELSSFTKPQLINSISNNCAAFVQVSETIIIGREAAFVGSVVFDLFNRRLELFKSRLLFRFDHFTNLPTKSLFKEAES